MTKLEKVLYTAKAHTTGGREGGASRTDDGRLEVKLSSPGTPGTGTNPEQLFAAGWSACFLSAIKLAAGKRKVALPAERPLTPSGLAQLPAHRGRDQPGTALTSKGNFIAKAFARYDSPIPHRLKVVFCPLTVGTPD